MIRLRDWQKSKVYRAETDWGSKGREFESLDAIKSYADELLLVNRLIRPGPAWVSGPGVRILDGRGSRAASAHGGSEMSFPRWARFERIVIHEIAHLVVVRRRWSGFTADHGHEFVRTLLELVEWKLGFDERQKFANCLRKRRVVWHSSDLLRHHPAHRDRFLSWAEGKVELPRAACVKPRS